jgi:hypothetical protein
MEYCLQQPSSEHVIACEHASTLALQSNMTRFFFVKNLVFFGLTAGYTATNKHIWMMAGTYLTHVYTYATAFCPSMMNGECNGECNGEKQSHS